MDPALHQQEKNIPGNDQSPDIDSSPLPPSGVAFSAHTSIDIGVSTLPEPNPYVTSDLARSAFMKIFMETARNMFGRWSKKVGEATKAADDLSRNVWQNYSAQQQQTKRNDKKASLMLSIVEQCCRPFGEILKSCMCST